jgi:hypothetical protein
VRSPKWKGLEFGFFPQEGSLSEEQIILILASHLCDSEVVGLGWSGVVWSRV